MRNGHHLPASGSIDQALPRARPLTELRRGQRASLHHTDLCPADCEMLSSMGLTDRCEIRLCKVGEPCILQVRATRLGIARSLASRILVKASG